MNQTELFAGPHALARNTDHGSSHAAAEQVERTGRAQTQRLQCYAAVARWPGSTTRQLSKLSGISTHTLGRRLPEMADESKYGGNAPIKRIPEEKSQENSQPFRWFTRRAL